MHRQENRPHHMIGRIASIKAAAKALGTDASKAKATPPSCFQRQAEDAIADYHPQTQAGRRPIFQTHGATRKPASIPCFLEKLPPGSTNIL